MDISWQEAKALLREVLEDEMGTGRHEIAPKYRGGTLVLKPADDALQGKREKLRVLEQKINNHKALSETDKAELQRFITKSYGSLTTFNVLFKEEEDRFVGSKES